MGELFEELKRRNVFRVGVAYLVTAWIVAQVAELLVEAFEAPPWALKLFLGVLALGLLIAVVVAWVYELTPEGIKREVEVDRSESVVRHTGRKLDRLIIVALVIALGYFIWESRFRDDRERGSPDAQVAAEESGERAGPGEPAVPEKQTPAAPAPQSVAVLPFVPLSSGADDEFFADGLTEEILNALAQLPELLVTARTSAFHFKGRDIPVPEIAATLGVAHVVEGSVRRSGDRIRVTAQLIRAEDGFHLWSENYDREMADTFSVQDDIARNIAEALDVVLDDDKRGRMREAGVQDVEAFVAYQKGMHLYDEAHRDLSKRNAVLELANVEFGRAITRVPGFFGANYFGSDLPAHRLMDAASGVGGRTPEALEADRRALREGLAAAHAGARTPEVRTSVDFTRIFLSGDWRGLREAGRVVLASDACLPVLYLYFYVVFDQAPRFLDFYRKQVTCDPLAHDVWTSFIPIPAYLGDPSGSLVLAAEAVSVAGTSSSLETEAVLGKVAIGDLDGARTALRSPALSERDAAELTALVLAAEGRAGEARQAAAEALERFGSGDEQALRLLAWVGDRDGANAAASRIDTHLLGSAVLVRVTDWCRCASPFDLEATPNFARQVAEAGLDWPPPAIIRLPGKDW
jgi:TolB-like protein